MQIYFVLVGLLFCFFIKMCFVSCEVSILYSDDAPTEVHIVYLLTLLEKKGLCVVSHENSMPE